MKRHTILAVLLAGVTLLATPALTGSRPWLIWNASASLPVGLYRVAAPGRVAVGDLVAVAPPKPLAAYLSIRGYLPPGVPLLKRVLALPGARVCRTGLTITIDGRAHGAARRTDSRGRVLPVWQGCRTIADGEVFLMNRDAGDSVDGRYFGPIQLDSVTARLVPLWTDVDGDGRFRWNRHRWHRRPLT